MANLCNYEMSIRADNSDDLDNFLNYLTANRSRSEVLHYIDRETNKAVPCDHRIGGRVYSSKPYDFDDTNSVYFAAVYGDCAWSVQTAFIDVNKAHNFDDECWSLQMGCEHFHVSADVRSYEIGWSFIEHYFIDEEGAITRSDVYDLDAFEPIDTNLPRVCIDELYQDYLNSCKEVGAMPISYEMFLERESDMFVSNGIIDGQCLEDNIFSCLID